VEPAGRDWLARLTGFYVNSIMAANRGAADPAFGKANPQFAAY
jgi:hypothetical protein